MENVVVCRRNAHERFWSGLAPREVGEWVYGKSMRCYKEKQNQHQEIMSFHIKAERNVGASPMSLSSLYTGIRLLLPPPILTLIAVTQTQRTTMERPGMANS